MKHRADAARSLIGYSPVKSVSGIGRERQREISEAGSVTQAANWPGFVIPIISLLSCNRNAN